jgi:NAD+ kinase
MKTIGIATNAGKDSSLKFTREIAEWLQKKGCKPLLPPEASRRLGLPELCACEDDLYRMSDMVAVLGGDGTVLRAAQPASLHDVPILGINLGTLGYLTDVDRHDGLKALESILNGKYWIESRIMLEFTGLEVKNPNRSLNEISISRGGSSKLIKMNLSVNGKRLDTIRADGIIVATPTGSTAYSLSAGGPILQPESEMMVISFICPHALYVRPCVVAASDEVGIELVDADDAAISMDGENKAFAKTGDVLLIKKSSCHAKIIRTKELSFFDILRQKMLSAAT